MRTYLGFVLIALSSCAAQPPAPAPPPAPAAPVRSPAPPARAPHEEEAPPAPSASSVTPPANPAGPVVVIDSEHISMEGKPVGSVRAIDDLGRLQKIDELFVTLANTRDAWKATHEGEAFPGVASLVVAPGTSGRAFASAYQTIAFAGFPRIQVAVNGRYYETLAEVPGPPCGTPENPCPSGPRQYVLHAQADPQRWRLRVPREDGPLDRMGEGPDSSLASFRAAASDVTSTAKVGAIVLHVAPAAPFSRFAPFLADVVELSKRASLPRGVTVSVLEIDVVNGTAGAAPIASGGASIKGRLAPELIQKVVRANFGKIRACYERVLMTNANAGGKAETRLVIGRNGTVTEAHTTLSGDLPPEMSACVEAVFRALTFQSPSGGIVTVVYPIVFNPGT